MKPLAVIFDLDDTLIRAYANRDAAWRNHIVEYAAALHPHDTVSVADAISSSAVRFWRETGVYERGGHDLQAARRTIVGTAFRNLAIDAPSLVTGQRSWSRPPFTSSKRITSAPICASVMPPNGAATKAEPSKMRIPSKRSYIDQNFPFASILKTSSGIAVIDVHAKPIEVAGRR